MDSEVTGIVRCPDKIARKISEQGSDEIGARYKRRVYRARSEIVKHGWV